MGEAHLWEAQAPRIVHLQDAVAECERLPRVPPYAHALDQATMQAVQERCTRVTSAQAQSFEPAAMQAIDAAWKQRTTGMPDEHVLRALPSVPSAFAFDRYEHVHLYAQPIPVRDHDAAEAKVCACRLTQPIHMAKHTAPPMVPSDAPTFVLEVSVYSRRHVPLTRRTRGLDGSVQDTSYETPTLGDMDGELVLSQKLECTSAHTLDDLVQEIVCRNGDLPHADYDDAHPCPSHWTSAHYAGHNVPASYPRYKEGVLSTDVSVLIDGRLYGRCDPIKDPDNSYVHALLQHKFHPASPLAKAEYGGTLQNTRISQLRTLSVHQPHWLLHIGDCEHVWTIDQISTTYLQRWMLASLIRQYWAPKKLVARTKRYGVPCEICNGMRNAVAAVLGGSAVLCRTDERVRLAGMEHLVTPCCATCFQMATGHELAHILQDSDALHAHGAWTVMPLFAK